MSNVVKMFGNLGVSLNPPKLIVIYGEPMAGKTTLSVLLASRLAESLNRKVAVVYTEPIWDDPEFQSFVVGVTNSKFDLVKLADWRHFSSVVGGLRDRFIVLDSISSLAGDMISRLSAMGWDLRAINPRVNQIVISLIHFFRLVVNNSKSVGVIVAHSASTAGTGKYRGLTENRPAFARRILHECDAELELRIGEEKDLRILTVIANRINPWSEGKSVAFKFAKGDIEPIEGGLAGVRVV